MRQHLDRGGVWFGARDGNELVSVCLAFPNYEDIWEIGGVYTRPGFRRRGWARVVVAAALDYLADHRLRPRYQFHTDNAASRALAESLGLSRVLTVSHYYTVS